MNAPTHIRRTPRRRRKIKGLGLPLAILTALVMGVAALLLALSAMPTNAQESPPTYTVTDIGIPPGDDYGWATAVNEVGQVVGYSEYQSADYASHAWLWQDDGDPTTADMKDLGNLGQVTTFAHGINDLGQVVGHGNNVNGNAEAWLWESGSGMQALSTPSGYKETLANDINNSGQVVGNAWNEDPVSGDPLDSKAFLWQNGTPTALPGLEGETSHDAVAINASGQIVGYGAHDQQANYRPILWENGTLTELPTLSGTIGSPPRDINDKGHVVGAAYYPRPTPESSAPSKAWFYNGRTVKALPAPPGGYVPGTDFVEAGAINNSGQIVGFAYKSPGETDHMSWLYSGGQMYDLKDLIPANSGWTEVWATNINDKGEIAGAARDANGQVHAVLLTIDIAPTVTAVEPAAGTKQISLGTDVTATFSEQMQPASVESAFKLYSNKKGTLTPVDATVTYDATANKATLVPSTDLNAGTTYLAMVTTEAKDLTGNALDQNPRATGNQQMKWTFKTGSS